MLGLAQVLFYNQSFKNTRPQLIAVSLEKGTKKC